MPEVAMPRLSDSMEEGTILKWLKSDGDEVARGEELVEIETDKATMTYESDLAGALEIVAAEGDTLAVGATMARIGANGSRGAADDAEDEREQPAAEEEQEQEQASAPAKEEDADAEEEPEPEAATDEAAEPTARADEAPPKKKDKGKRKDKDKGKAGDERAKASPLARRLARAEGLDLSALQGSGPGGRIVRADVESAAAHARTGDAPQGSGAAGGTGKGRATIESLSRIQQVIARRMAEAKATIPEFTLTADVDMEACVELRSALKEAASDAAVPSYNDMVVKACALALREFPRANGSYRDGEFELHGRINVGIAVAADDALLVPTVFDADTRSLGDIARTTRELAERVRAGAITPPELSGGTFSVSNLGMFGVKHFAAVINPPQAAILAVGAMAPTAVVRDGAIVARHVMPVTLTIDHRIVYGADGAQFLARIRELLETPLALLL